MKRRVLTADGKRGVALAAWVLAGFFAAISVLCPRAVAQTSLPDTPANRESDGPFVGQITGDDISVVGESRPLAAGDSRSIEFAGGSTIVVHKGKARIEFTGGEEMDICGPAKFTVLASGQALTIALSFGRVHVQADALRPIAIYTPSVIATLLAIGDEPRDMALELSSDGSMCVLAAQGAVEIQKQLSGEIMVVPQPSEIYIRAGASGAAAAPAGSCNCDFDDASAKSPEAANGNSQNATAASRSPDSQSTGSEQVISKTMMSESSNEKHLSGVAKAQNATKAGNSAAEDKQASATPRVQTVLVQKTRTKNPDPLRNAQASEPEVPELPIGFDVSGTLSSAEPISVATLLLAKEEVVESGWIFEGEVSAGGADSHHPAVVEKNNSRHERKGFWARFRSWFFGR